jgi:tRNA(Arg) A34 adenosine deaminase TadA
MGIIMRSAAVMDFINMECAFFGFGGARTLGIRQRFPSIFPRQAPELPEARKRCIVVAMNEVCFMMRAIELARQGMTRGDGGPFGAVVVRDGTIIGEGWNRVLATNDPTAHGEVTAIRDACARAGTFDLTGCVIYTTGEPCPMCLGAVYWARIARIRYGFSIEDAAEIGFDDRAFYRQFALPPGDRDVPAESICRNEALELAAEYAALPGRRIY